MIRQLLFVVMGFMVIMLISGCAGRTAYHDSYIKESKAVLYVYRPNSVYNNQNVYDIIIDGTVKGQIYENAYSPIEVDPGSLSVTIRNHDVIVGNIENARITFDDIQAGNAYYLKIDVTELDTFYAYEADPATAKREIVKTSLVDADAKKFKIYKSAGTVEAEADAKVQVKESVLSTSEEIEKLYRLKEKGAITEEEYNMLKAKVMAK